MTVTSLVLDLQGLPLPPEVVKYCTDIAFSVASSSSDKKVIVAIARRKLSYSTAVTQLFIDDYCDCLHRMVNDA